jgi:hypothetical protein
MRFVLLAAASAILLAGAAQAQSSWMEYTYPDSGFAVSFPASPAVGRMKVKTPAGTDADETLYAVQQRDSIFRISVTDFRDGMVDGNAAIDRAVAELAQRGSVTLNLPARVNRNRGRQLSLTGKDGSHSTIAIFFGDHKLYEIEGTTLASNSDPASGNLIRFQQSLRFTGEGAFGQRGFGRGFGPGGPPGGGFRGGRRFRQNPPPPQDPPPDDQPKNNG